MALAAKATGGIEAFVDKHRPKGMSDEQWAEARKTLIDGMNHIDNFIGAMVNKWRENLF